MTRARRIPPDVNHLSGVEGTEVGVSGAPLTPFSCFAAAIHGVVLIKHRAHRVFSGSRRAVLTGGEPISHSESTSFLAESGVVLVSEISWSSLLDVREPRSFAKREFLLGC